VDVSWDQPNSASYGLVFRITNRSKQSVELPYATLWRKNVILVIVGPNGEVRDRNDLEAFSDLPVGSWKLPPDGSIEKEIVLTHEYPDLWAAPFGNSVVVFWSLSLLTREFDQIDRIGGFLEVRPGIDPALVK
jgi:hypothetical protein